MRVASDLAIDRIRGRRPAFAEPDTVPAFAEAVSLRLALGAALQAFPRRQCQVVALR